VPTNWDDYEDKYAEYEDTKASGETTPGGKAVDNSPTGYQAKPVKLGIMGTTYGEYTRPEEQQKQAASAGGVDVTTGAPKGLNTGLESFAISPDIFNDYVDKHLKSIMPDAEIRKSPFNGKPEYFNPITKKWTSLEDSTVGQWAIRKAGQSIDQIGALASLVGPQKAGALQQMLSSSAKTGGATALTDYLRLKIGDAAGVNDGKPGEGERVGEAVKTGLTAGGADLATQGVFNIGRYFKQAIKGRPVFTEAEAQQLLDGLGKYDDIADEINKKSDVPFTPFLHQMVDPNVPAAQVAERWYKSLLESSDPAIRMKVLQARSNQFGAVRSYFQNANKEFDQGIPATAEGRVQAGAPTAQGIQDAHAAGMQDAQANVAAQEQIGRQQVNTLPGQSVGAQAAQSGGAVRDQLFAQARTSSAQVDDAYKNFQNSIAYDARTNSTPYRVQVSPELATIINKFGRNTITKDLKGGKPHIDTKGNVSVDVSTLDDTAKYLEEQIRNKTAGMQQVDFGDRDLVDAKQKVTDALTGFLKKGSQDGTLAPEAYNTYMAARAAAKQDASNFKNGFLSGFLKKGVDGKWEIADRDVMEKILSMKDTQAMGQIKDMIQGDPVAMSEVKKMLFKLYEKKATQNGLPSAKLHAKFMANDQYGDIMNIFFKNEDFDKLSTMGDVAGSLAQSVQQSKEVEKQLYQQLGGKITRWSPENIVKNVLSGSLSQDETKKLMAIAMRTGGLKAYKDLQNGVMNEVQMQMFPQGLDASMNTGVLDKILDKYGANLKAALGDDYYNSLDTIRKTTPMLQRNPPGIGDPPVQTRLQQLLRAAEGPMSRAGTMMTFLKWNRGANLPGAIWDALTSKDELSRLANHTKAAVAGNRVAGAIGAQSALQLKKENEYNAD
jgi:hypothetical protein